ncbi:MAG: DUF937 domain-containing protein [Saprospiraceae bacterium]|nr:DUF937 domain-containing protein [Saprospiraceae bacterium]
MNLMDVLQGQLNESVLGHISEQIGADKEQTAQAANGIFASLLGGMANQAGSENGMGSLLQMLDRDGDGSILDDVMEMMGGALSGQGGQAGMGLIGQILGDQHESTANQISQSTGLSMGQVMKLMPALAPIVLGVLTRTRAQGNVDQNGMADLLMDAVGGLSQNPQMTGMLGNLAGTLLGGGRQSQQQGGLGDLLGNIFGGR